MSITLLMKMTLENAILANASPDAKGKLNVALTTTLLECVAMRTLCDEPPGDMRSMDRC